jgi:hypothetical protein
VYLWIPAKHPPEDWPDESEDHQRYESEVPEALPGFLHCFYLGSPDLMMNLSEGFLVGGSDNVDDGLFLASQVTLNQGRHVYLIK